MVINNGKMWGFMVVVVGVLLVMVPAKSMQLRADDPVHSVVNRINTLYGPHLAIVLTSASDEKRLLASGLFVSTALTPPPVNYAGRTFKFGLFKGVPSTYVVLSSPSWHKSSTLQILLDLFRIVGIIDYGSAGSVSEELEAGDVAVVDTAAFTGNWNWQEEGTSESSSLPLLKFGDYNTPKAGGNKLGSIEFQKVAKILSGDKTFSFHADENYLQIAEGLKDLPMEKCVANAKDCDHIKPPRLVYGVKSSSSDIYVSNEAYGKFLRENFDVGVVDTKSAIVIATAEAKGVPVIVFRAITNKPGVANDKDKAELARKNCLKVAAAFAVEIQIRGRKDNNIRMITNA